MAVPVTYICYVGAVIIESEGDDLVDTCRLQKAFSAMTRTHNSSDHLVLFHCHYRMSFCWYLVVVRVES